MYYSIKRISNSDLQIAKHLIMGIPLRRSIKAFDFGTALHQAVLEPDQFDISLYPKINKKQLNLCLNTLYRSRECLDLLEGSHEQEVYWRDFYTGIDCKSKLDIYRHNTIVDLKTTRARSLQEFEAYALAYEYDRQMAFYADSVAAQHIVLIGISKMSGELFIIRTHHRSEFISLGRAKYQYILSKIKALNLFDRIWEMRQKT